MERGLARSRHGFVKAPIWPMVKPGMPYLDVIRAVRAFQARADNHGIRSAAGVRNAVRGGTKRLVGFGSLAYLESLVAFKRAGADEYLTYFALEAAGLLDNGFIKGESWSHGKTGFGDAGWTTRSITACKPTPW